MDSRDVAEESTALDPRGGTETDKKDDVSGAPAPGAEVEVVEEEEITTEDLHHGQNGFPGDFEGVGDALANGGFPRARSGRAGLRPGSAFKQGRG